MSRSQLTTLAMFFTVLISGKIMLSHGLRPRHVILGPLGRVKFGAAILQNINIITQKTQYNLSSKSSSLQYKSFINATPCTPDYFTFSRQLFLEFGKMCSSQACTLRHINFSQKSLFSPVVELRGRIKHCIAVVYTMLHNAHGSDQYIRC